MDIDAKQKQQAKGGNTNKPSHDIYTLDLQLYGFPRKTQTYAILHEFLYEVAIHEIFHFFMPYVHNCSCWSEGVTDFMTMWFCNNLDKFKIVNEWKYNNQVEQKNKAHRYGYVTGYKKMYDLYQANKEQILKDIFRMIKDYWRNDETIEKEYTPEDIIQYNEKFKTFFANTKCMQHILWKN